MKKLKGIVLVVILSLASIMMPFDVYADTIDSHIRGRNYNYEPITYNEIQVSTTTYYQNIGVFHITFELDDEYIGYVLPNYTLQYDNYFYGAQTPNWGTLSITFDRRIFVNGSSFSFDVTVNWNSININSAPGGDPFNYDSYTITSSDVTKYADIDSIDQIINILQDLYNSNDQVEGLLNDQLTQLQLIVSNTSLANDYLEIISAMRQWNIPFESYIAVSSAIFNNLELLQDSYGYQYYNYPIYKVKTNDKFIRYYISSNNNYSWIMYHSLQLSKSNFTRYIDFNLDITLDSVNRLYNGLLYTDIGQGYFYKIDFTANETGYLDFTSLSNDIRYIPIFIGLSSDKYISTDFALQFGLSNQLLDDLHIIAKGTTQSNSAASDLESSNDQMADDMNDLATIENNYNQQFNNQLQSIDFTSPIQNNAGILPAANFVITIFNGLINNNPFSVLIIVVCILLIGKKVIGK